MKGRGVNSPAAPADSEEAPPGVTTSMKAPTSGAGQPRDDTPARFLSTTQIAARLGITRAAVSKYRLPEPDAWIGSVRGWLPETIDWWDRERPGQGARTDRKNTEPPAASRS